MQGNAVHFVCADDTHGAPIMIAAEKAGKTPQQFVADIAAGRKPYLDGFHIAFDNWHSTDAPENHELAQDIYRDLKANGLIETRTIEQFFDPEKNMFLPDRFIKGECPKCHAKDQYGDNCEVCGAVYAPTDLINPYSALGRQAAAQKLGALLLQAVRPALRGLPGRLDAKRPPAARGGQQDQGMVHRAHQRRRQRPARAWATGTSAATRPTSASRSPTRRASTSTSGWTRPSATWPR
jgi:hypothetical protein